MTVNVNSDSTLSWDVVLVHWRLELRIPKSINTCTQACINSLLLFAYYSIKKYD